MTAPFEQVLRLGLALEAVVAGALTLALATTVGVRRLRARSDARRLDEGRGRLVRALQQGDMTTAQMWLVSQPPRIQLALCSAFVRSVDGVARRELQQLALRLGILERAEADVRSRRWSRRLRGIRVLTALAPPGFDDALCREAHNDHHQTVRNAARVWQAAELRNSSLKEVDAASLRETAVAGLTPSTGTAVDDATRALTDTRGEVRLAAIRLLATFSHWPSAAAMYRLLDDPEFGVRREAAAALVRFGAPGQLFLRRALTEASTQARDAAQHTLDVNHVRLEAQ